MALGGFLGGLANLGAISQGADEANYRDILRRLNMEQLRQRQMQQQEQSAIGQLLGSGRLNQLMGQVQPPVQAQPPQMPGGGGGPMPPQIPPAGGAMGAQPPMGMQPSMIAQQPQPPGGRFGGMAGLSQPDQLSRLISQMESSGGTQNASQPPSMVDKTYGQYPGFASQYGTGPIGVDNFAKRMLAERPDATVGDYYSNYVLGTGGTGKTPADLASTTVPGARGAYQNMESKLAAAGIPDTTPLASLMRGMPPEQRAQIDPAATQTLRQNPALIQNAGRWDMDGLVKAIDETHPGLDPEVKAGIFFKMAPLLSAQAKEQAATIWQQYKFGESQKEKQEEFRIRDEEAKARLAETKSFHEQSLGARGGSMYQPTDAEGKPMGPPMWVAGGKASPVTGLPEGAAGGAKVGTKPPGGGVSNMQAEWVASYIQATGTWPVGSGRNIALQNKVDTILAQKGVDPQKIAQAKGAFVADQSSLTAATKLADATASYEGTAKKNLKIATEQLHKAAPTNYGPWLNKWIETGETFAGNPDVPPSVAAVITLANEYAKVMSGATGGAPATDSSRREAATILNPYFSSAQWDAVVDEVIVPDMRNRIESLNDQKEIIKSRIGRGGATTGEPTAAPAAPAEGKPSAQSILDDLKSGKISKDEAIQRMNKYYPGVDAGGGQQP